jgi:hypothetical protein
LGRNATCEADPDVGSASVHCQKNGDRFAFLHPLADQQRTLGAGIAQIHAAVTEDDDGIIVEPVDNLKRNSTTELSAPGILP